MAVQGDYLNFKPLIKSSYYQTLIGSTIDFELDLASQTHRIHLPDGDLISIEVSTPENWSEKKWTVLMLHGLCGSHKSHYM
jgi:predicted alpha/beta-fold hydrolase